MHKRSIGVYSLILYLLVSAAVFVFSISPKRRLAYDIPSPRLATLDILPIVSLVGSSLRHGARDTPAAAQPRVLYEMRESLPPPKRRLNTSVLPFAVIPSRHVNLPSWDTTLKYARAPNASTNDHYTSPSDPSVVAGDSSWLRTFNPSVAAWRRHKSERPSLLVVSRVGPSFPCDGPRPSNADGINRFFFIGLSTPFDLPGMAWVAAPQMPVVGPVAGYKDARVIIDPLQDRVVLVAGLIELAGLDSGRWADHSGALWLIELSGPELAAAMDHSMHSGLVEPIFPVRHPLRLSSTRFSALEKNYVSFPITSPDYIVLSRWVVPFDVIRCSRFDGYCTDDIPAVHAIAKGVLPLVYASIEPTNLRGSTHAVEWDSDLLLAVAHVQGGVRSVPHLHYYSFFYTFTAAGELGQVFPRSMAHLSFCCITIFAEPHAVRAASSLFVLHPSGPILEFVNGMTLAANGDVILSASITDCSSHLYIISRSVVTSFLNNDETAAMLVNHSTEAHLQMLLQQ
jgi:hypothetical protein